MYCSSKRFYVTNKDNEEVPYFLHCGIEESVVAQLSWKHFVKGTVQETRVRNTNYPALLSIDMAPPPSPPFRRQSHNIYSTFPFSKFIFTLCGGKRQFVSVIDIFQKGWKLFRTGCTCTCLQINVLQINPTFLKQQQFT
jgi:hypothetical protein